MRHVASAHLSINVLRDVMHKSTVAKSLGMPILRTKSYKADVKNVNAKLKMWKGGGLLLDICKHLC